ncbi:hypothetical protein F0919_10775 [Taibaiella lutea]|uniref:DUF4129 domain-containing protein n=1 Tax=Taibaiella lutea TaxID=2608001 RepID=A0A5M6CIP6_9BACT|nr:hypothetical protein [Taibaiella lutea]KAA5535071.1 hypothetical protein F0919_10775 [Taibaiella lutea]
MSRFLKTIFIVFLFLNFCLCRQTAFAWQSPYSSTQDSLSDQDDSYDATTPDNELAQEDAPAEEDYSYNEAHFYEANTAPAPVKRNISNADWNKLTQDPAFNYEDEKEEIKPPQEYKPGWWERMFQAIFDFIGSAAGKVIIIVIVVLIVLVLIFRIFQLNGNIFFSKKDKNLLQQDTDDENHIPDDWEKEINMAAQTGNYRLALRYSYRYLLMMLQEKEKINFQVAKTNYQYVYELKGTNFYKPVMQLTREYEYAWYGGFDIEKPFFENYQQMVAGIKRELNY